MRGSDGQVKGAAIKLGDEGKRSNIICRPIQKLFLLETSRVNTKLEETDMKWGMKFSEQKPDVVRRINRDAAVLGELKRRYVDTYCTLIVKGGMCKNVLYFDSHVLPTMNAINYVPRFLPFMFMVT